MRRSFSTLTLVVLCLALIAPSGFFASGTAQAQSSAPTLTLSPSTVEAGQSATLTATFPSGVGVVNPGNITVTSGKGIAVTPSATTAYTLTVTQTAGATLTVTPLPSSASDLGVNIGWVNDWDPTQMFADAMKQARKFGNVNSPYDELAHVDSLGWPTQDAGVVVMVNYQGPWSVGTYALSFTGQATVTAWDNYVSVGPVTYNSGNNTSTATVTVGPSYQSVYLIFKNTKRTQTSAVGSGVTNVSLMRPAISGTPHAAGTLFTDRFLERLKYFTAVRMMDYLGTNNSTEQAWADRSIPTYASQQEEPGHTSQDVSSTYVTGAAYEYAIQLANQSGKDLWLNVPHLAFGGTYQFTSTQWATNLALMLKYGSDAKGNPYTGVAGSSGANPQPASGPVNPGLKSGLHVYIEWSNEFWSGVGNQSNWINTQAQDAINARDPDLDWDGNQDHYDLVWRMNAKGAMLIAEAFANVYGANGFGNIYRPIMAGQIANVGMFGQTTYTGTFGGLTYLDERHGGADQYVWAIAGAPYVDFNGDVYGNNMSEAQVLTGMQSYQTANLDPWIADLAALAKAEKLTGGMVAYEGGQGALYSTPGAMAAQKSPIMRTIDTADLDAWFADGGNTFFYYKLESADQWGLAEDVSYDIDADKGYTPNPATSAEVAPKWGAIKQVATLGH